MTEDEFFQVRHQIQHQLDSELIQKLQSKVVADYTRKKVAQLEEKEQQDRLRQAAALEEEALVERLMGVGAGGFSGSGDAGFSGSGAAGSGPSGDIAGDLENAAQSVRLGAALGAETLEEAEWAEALAGEELEDLAEDIQEMGKDAIANGTVENLDDDPVLARLQAEVRKEQERDAELEKLEQNGGPKLHRGDLTDEERRRLLLKLAAMTPEEFGPKMEALEKEDPREHAAVMAGLEQLDEEDLLGVLDSNLQQMELDDEGEGEGDLAGPLAPRVEQTEQDGDADPATPRASQVPRHAPQGLQGAPHVPGFVRRASLKADAVRRTSLAQANALPEGG